MIFIQIQVLGKYLGWHGKLLLLHLHFRDCEGPGQRLVYNIIRQVLSLASGPVVSKHASQPSGRQKQRVKEREGEREERGRIRRSRGAGERMNECSTMR